MKALPQIWHDSFFICPCIREVCLQSVVLWANVLPQVLQMIELFLGDVVDFWWSDCFFFFWRFWAFRYTGRREICQIFSSFMFFVD